MSAAAEAPAQSVLTHVHRDTPLLASDLTVGEALNVVREHGIGERIVYFYVVDGEERLVGVLPTRRLLTAAADARIGDIMISHVVALPETATVLDACEVFATHRYLALPVVDADRRVVGVVDVSLFADEVFDLAERQEVDDLFETIGFRVSQVRSAGTLLAFRFRFPWLMATIAGGIVCAVLAAIFSATLSSSLVLAFFLPLALGLGEAVAVQSLTVTIQLLRGGSLKWRALLQMVGRELPLVTLLGLGCGALVLGVVAAWFGAGPAAFAIGLALVIALAGAGVLGLVVPFVVHRLRLDLKIAAGPLTLALADIVTVLAYLSVATALL